ncbi:N-acyl-D-amino-acid deacylase family protein [Cryptosporangium minutisporangium]|uniref:Amidohydrolase family protein n=1 Tax=Cryptosporangium minutisporangium TaxID=113569 RepID=A0ABP6STX8_9ACTN
MTDFDLVIRGGRWFDGTGAPSAIRDLGVRDGLVVEVADGAVNPLPVGPATEVIDATGRWVLPGMVDLHTHYDAEVLVSPGLKESVRHGVTTVVVGNCSLSTIYVEPVDAADLFSRVEALPRQHVLTALGEGRTWTRPSEWAAAVEQLPLGPNVASFLGHSDLRTTVMGLGRATDRSHRPAAGELRQMTDLLSDALDAGFIGLSTMTNPWDKLDGDRYRSRSLPSTYAHWSEYRTLHRLLRKRGAILQSIPNLNTKYDVLFFLGTSTGIGRKALKTSLLSAADPKSDRWLWRIFGPLSWLANGPGRGNFRFQHLPVPFEVHADGVDLVVFEEFGAGAAALHLQDELERDRLLRDEGYRRWFRRDFEKRFSSRVWHRDFADAYIVECPDASLVGQSVADVAEARGVHVVDAFLDLVVEHGRKFRWKTTIVNDRPEILDRLSALPGVQYGFSDAGAHLRNMAFYNYGLRLLGRVRDAERAGRPFLTTERAVHRLTGELADWLGLDAGHLRVGDRADLVVVDPAGLDADVLASYHEEPLPEFGGLRRMVNRNDAAVDATVIGGEVVFSGGEFRPEYGVSRRTGRFLRYREESRAPLNPVRPPAFSEVERAQRSPVENGSLAQATEAV